MFPMPSSSAPDSACRAGLRLRAGEGGGAVELLFNGYRVSVWEDEKVLEMDGGNGCTIV